MPANRCCVALLSWMWLVTSLAMVVAADGPLQVTLDERQLLLDDVQLAKIDNLKRTMHQPQKKGAVIRGDYVRYPGCTLQTRSTPIWDPNDEVYRLWVMGLVPSNSVGLTVTGSASAVYESKDGLNWYAPNLGRVAYKGTKDNNLVSAIIGGKRIRTDCVIYDRFDPDPNRRYKLAVPDVWTRGEGGFAASPNGIDWTETQTPGVPSHDEWNLTLDEKERLFIHYVKHSGPNGRAIHISTSKDFENWSDHRLVYWADDQDQEIARQRIAERFTDKTRKFPEFNVPETYRGEVYHMSIFRYESHYIGIPAYSYHTGSVPKDWPGFDEMRLSPEIEDAVRTYGDYTWFYELQLASSRDLDHWDRQGERQPWIKNSTINGGAYDLLTIISPAGAVIRGDELWFYYTGINQYAFITSGIRPGYDDYIPDRGAICLATLRRDGFVSLDAGDAGGLVETKPVRVDGKNLFANVVCGKNGSLHIEAVDSNGNVLGSSEPIVGDQPQAEVKWQQGSWSDWSGKAVSLRFLLKNGELYSYWMSR